MQIKLIVAAAGLVALALPLAVFASQPDVKQTPSLAKAQVLSMLLLDPRESVPELSVELPTGYATLDVDADPFGVVTN